MIALIVTASLVAYLVIGVVLAVSDLPKIWAWALEPKNRSEEIVRKEVVGAWWMTVALWPVVYSVQAVNSRVGRVVDSADPREARRKVAEQERRIAELERELGIGRNR